MYRRKISAGLLLVCRILSVGANKNSGAAIRPNSLKVGTQNATMGIASNSTARWSMVIKIKAIHFN